MRFIFLVLAICVTALPFSVVAAQKVLTFPKPDIHMLDNGMQVVVLHNDRIPAVKHMVWYRVGSMDESGGESGIAHLLEHLMFKETEIVNDGEQDLLINYYGGNQNAFTSNDVTAYHATIPKEYLELLVILEAQRMQGLLLDDASIETEIQVVLEERNIRIDSKPRALLAEQMTAALYRNHPYGTPLIGWRHEIEMLDKDAIRAFYRRYYNPDNAMVVVVGDVTMEEFLPLAERYYGGLSNQNIPPHDGLLPRPALAMQEPPSIAARSVVMQHPQVKQAEWMRYYLAPSVKTAGADDAVALNFAVDILGGSQTSRLYQSLVVEQQIANQVSMHYYDMSWGPSKVVLTILPNHDVSREMIDAAVATEIDRLLQEGVTDDEMARVRIASRASIVMAQEGNAGLARIYGNILSLELGSSYVDDWAAELEQVTEDAVVEAVRRYLLLPRSVTGWLEAQPQAGEYQRGDDAE